MNRPALPLALGSLLTRPSFLSVKVDNCVLSNGVQVRDRAILRDCELGRDVIVDVESEYSSCLALPLFGSRTDGPSAQLNSRGNRLWSR